MKRFEVEQAEDWRGWIDKIPSLDFPQGWHVKIIPPFTGAMVRFQVTTDQGGWTSVYLDCLDKLGYMGQPYWEVYPHEGDTYRCLMSEVDDLIKAIGESLKEREL